MSDGRPAPLKGATLAVTALALALGTFMQVLDLTIANVSLPTIAGNLGVSTDSGTWIITSFAVSNGISVPLTGWLMGRYGVVRVFTLSVIAFTIASLLCGIAWNLPVLIVFRVIQGAVSGPMIPGSQALLISIFPPEKRGTGLGIWSITTLVAPIAGPVLGGYISDNYHWSWIFLINIPVGIFVAFDRPGGWLKSHETPTRRLPIDRVGLGLMLIIWVGALQVMLDLGKNADWFHDPLIVVLAAMTVIGFLAWMIWELTDAHPIVDLSLVYNRNFLFGSIALCFGFAIYFANVVLLPLWLQTQLGYTATWAGLAVAPSGVIAVVLTPLIARLMRVVDVRWIATMSFGALVASYLMRASYTTDVSFTTIAIGSAVQGVGSSGFFLSLLTILLDRVPPSQTPLRHRPVEFRHRIVVGSFATSRHHHHVGPPRGALSSSRAIWSKARNAGIGELPRCPPSPRWPGLTGTRAPMPPSNASWSGQAYLLSTIELYWAFALMTGIMILFVWLTKRAKGGQAAAGAE